MKKIFYIFNLVWLISATSCQDDILDKEPLEQYTDAVVWSTTELIESFLTTQYMYTPVMIQDATTMFTSWSGSPMNRDPRSGNGNYFFGNSAQVFGVGLTMEVSDETKYSLGSWDEAYTTYKLRGITADGGELEWWENAYYTIRNLNNFIEKAPESPLNKEYIETRIAEARFLRAYCYFAMVKRYGGVPLILTVPTMESPEELLYPKRNSEKEVYDFVLNETEEIAGILPEPENTDYGRAHKYAAWSLHCRAALYAGSTARYGTEQLNGLLGISRSEADAYFTKAYNAAKTIIQSGKYELYNVNADKVQNFKDIFLKKRNKEAIFVKQHDGPGFNDGGLATWSWDVIECPRPQVWGIGNAHMPYLDLVEEFEMADGTSGKLDRQELESKLWTMDELWKGRDPRFYASIWTNGTEWRDAGSLDNTKLIFGVNKIDMHSGLIKPDGEIITGTIATYEGIRATGDQLMLMASSNVVSTGFGIMKYLDPTANTMTWLCESRTDYQIFRYAETLLNLAEAAFELNKTSEALDAVNQIRLRAGIPALATVDMEKIRHERMVELAFENHRYWDLRRWREAETKLTRSFNGLRYLYDYESGKFKVQVIENVDGTFTPRFPAHTYYFPINKTRIGANPNLVENPGY